MNLNLHSMELREKKCICNKKNDTVLYPQRIDWSTFSSYEFSARRERKIQHYRIIRCNSCGLVRSDPVLSEDALASLYKDCRFLYANESTLAASTYASLTKNYIKPLSGRQGYSLLEIGCGNGTFLEEMMNYGIDNIVGVEPAADVLNFASDKIKKHIVNDVFKYGHFGHETFDMVCAFHLLDHLSDPESFVKESCRILKKNGKILLICHDVEAPVNKILKERSPVFDIEHIFLFNKNTLKNLVEKNGFAADEVGDVVNTYQVSYWLKYIPFLNKAIKFLPKSVRDAKVPLKAGNIFICAQKK